MSNKEYNQGYADGLAQGWNDGRQSAKKEVFDDIESLSVDQYGIDSEEYNKIKNKHLNADNSNKGKEGDSNEM